MNKTTLKQFFVKFTSVLLGYFSKRFFVTGNSRNDNYTDADLVNATYKDGHITSFNNKFDFTKVDEVCKIVNTDYTCNTGVANTLRSIPDVSYLTAQDDLYSYLFIFTPDKNKYKIDDDENYLQNFIIRRNELVDSFLKDGARNNELFEEAIVFKAALEGGSSGNNVDTYMFETTIRSLQARANEFEVSISSLQSSFVSNVADITALRQRQDEQQNSIAQNASSIAQNASSITALLQQVAQNTADIKRFHPHIEYIDLAENQGVTLRGTWFVDTGLTLNGNANISGIFALQERSSSTRYQNCFFGARKTNDDRTFVCYNPSDRKIYSYWEGEARSDVEFRGQLFSKFEIFADKNKTEIITKEQTVTINNTGYSESDNYTPFCLFCRDNSIHINDGDTCVILVKLIYTASYKTFEFVPKIKIVDGENKGVVLMKNSEELKLEDGAYLEIVDIPE